MTSSESTTCYNRASDHSNINDLFTPDKIIVTADTIIGGFLLSSSDEKDDLVNPSNSHPLQEVEVVPQYSPSYSHPLQEVEAVPQSLREYNVSQEQWSKLRNGILFQQELHAWIALVCTAISIIAFLCFYMICKLTIPSGKCRRSSYCKAIIEPSNFPGGEDVLIDLLLSLAAISLLSGLVAIVHTCLQPSALDRICRNTQLGTTNDVVSVRICRDFNHRWIELYIPSTFLLPQVV
jgi:hypothetical protein